MTRFPIVLICFAILLQNATAEEATTPKPFVPVIEDNKATDTSPEEITEVMKPICKILLDSDASRASLSGAFSPDGRYFATSNNALELTTDLYDLQTGKNLKRFAGRLITRDGEPAPVAFSPDSKRLAFIGANDLVVYDIPKDNIVCQIPLSENRDVNHYAQVVISALRFSDDGKTIMWAAGNAGNIWDTAMEGVELKTFSPGTSARTVFLCYPDMSHALIAEENTGKQWLRNLETNVDTERVVKFCRLDYYSFLGYRHKLVFSDDLQFFATETQSSTFGGNLLFIWDATTGSDICAVPISYRLTAMTFLPKSYTLITVSDPNPTFITINNYQFSSLLQDDPRFPSKMPMRIPVVKAETRAIVEFWDFEHLTWYPEKRNMFPRKIKTYYLEPEDDIQHYGDIRYMTASADGKLLYMRPVTNGNSTWYRDKHVDNPFRSGSALLSHGYIFSLDPDNKSELPAEILLDNGASVVLRPVQKSVTVDDAAEKDLDSLFDDLFNF